MNPFFHFSFFFHHFSPFFTYFFIFFIFFIFSFFSFSFIFLIFFHLGASSRRPRHPFSALMAGVSPGRVPVHTALKKVDTPAGMSSTCPRDNVNCGTPTVPALSRPAQTPVVAQRQACERQCPASKLQLWDLDCLLTYCTTELAGLAQPTSTALSRYCKRRISMVSEQ